jgi:hypothetical protein
MTKCLGERDCESEVELATWSQSHTGNTTGATRAADRSQV